LLRRPPRFFEVSKLISKDEYIHIVFANSLIVVVLDNHFKLWNQFRVDHPRFIRDLTRRLRNAKKKQGWVNGIGPAFLDNHGNICFCYYNSKQSRPEIYRYEKSGKFVDCLRIRNNRIKSNRIVLACDSRGYYYGINETASKIIVYHMDPPFKEPSPKVN
jgi:hypothetical protein